MNMTLNGLELWKAAGNFANEPHVHNEWYQITMPVRGVCALNQERQSYQLSAGRALLAHPQTEHFFHMDSDTSVIVIKFQRLPSCDGQGGQEQSEFRELHAFDPGEINHLFRSWSAILLEDLPEPLRLQELEYAVQLYLGELLQGRGDPHSRMEALTTQVMVWPTNTFLAPVDSHMARVLDYIHSSYTSGTLDIDSMAAVAHQSRYHFMRSFKALTGSTPHQYVLKLRVEQASALLRCTGAKVTEICIQSGFSSIDQFYRAFLRLKGVTPTEYRRQS
ncbi:Bifunctional transcriptional activator/DNA repair enzyme AdaA [compost metagenome]